MKLSQERISILSVLVVAFFWGLFPIVVNKGAQHIPPLFFAAVSILLGSLTTLTVSIIKKTASGILLLGLVNIFWYADLKRLPISKAVFLLMTYPLLSLLFLTVIFREPPNIFQVAGIFIIILGSYFTTRLSVNPATR